MTELLSSLMQVIQLICDRVAVIEAGRVVEEGSVLEVFGQPKEEVTKRFVRTVINDQVPETFYDTIRAENRHYRLEQLKFIGDSVNEPVIANLCRRQGLEVNIIGANISQMQGSMMSVFILQLIGEAEALGEAERYIDASGALRQRLFIDWDSRSITEIPAGKGDEA
jgi:D-methionine transport system ATP-binding protein